MKVTVTKQFTFDAAHFLEDYDGDCARMHGHTYKLEVTVSGDLNKDMVIDFKVLKELVRASVIKHLDHQVLNDVLPFNTTAENIAVWIFKILVTHLVHHTVEKIRLWETSNAYAEVTK